MEILAETLKALRKAHGLSQQDIADWFGINRSSVNAWENPEKKAAPELDKLKVIARNYRVSIDAMLDGTALLGLDSQTNTAHQTNEPPLVGYSVELSTSIIIKVRSMIRLSDLGAVQELAPVTGSITLIRTDKIKRSGEYYALMVASSNHPAIRNGTAILVSKNQPYKLDRLAVVTLKSGELFVMAPLVEDPHTIKFESLDGLTKSMLRSDISTIEFVAAMDSEPEVMEGGKR